MLIASSCRNAGISLLITNVPKISKSILRGEILKLLEIHGEFSLLKFLKGMEASIPTILTFLKLIAPRLIFALLMNMSPYANAQFSGTLELNPVDCQIIGVCNLTYDLKYRDPLGVNWQANAKNKTDGASIPAWAQPIVGKPFDPLFIRAAIIHDHYCDRHVRPWRQTHQVFYDGLIDSGVSITKAKLMYYAVYLGGPKWVTLIKGNNCGSSNCINMFSANGSVLKIEPSHFDEPGFVEEIAAVKTILESDEKAFTLKDLESRAHLKRPDSYFYSHGDSVRVNEIQITE